MVYGYFILIAETDLVTSAKETCMNARNWSCNILIRLHLSVHERHTQMEYSFA